MCMLFVSIQITMDTSTRPTPSFTRCEIIMGMDTLKRTWTGTIGMPHTATITMVQRLAEGMISTLQIMQDTIITPTLVVAAIRIQVPIVTVVCGLEAVASAQMS